MRIRQLFFIVVFLSALLCLPHLLLALTPEREEQLRQELTQVNQEIAVQQAILKQKQLEGGSIERDLAILNAQIAETKLSIRAKNIALLRLGKDIGEKEKTIDELERRIEKNKDSLAYLLRRTRELEEYSITEIFLANRDFKDFFSDVDSYDFIQKSLHTAYQGIVSDKSETEDQKQTLEDKSRKEEDARAEIESKKREVEKKETQKKTLLQANKKEQKSYAAILTERKRRAGEIRATLFSLRDSAAIPFGTALEYAQKAYEKTGVRPAFLLAILTQETNLGANVGTCNRPGDPASKSWRVVMKPDRDQGPFLEITSELGLNPDIMPVSCPISGGGGGWGGALGPAQFIPSTWQIYKKKVATALGKSVANPWDPQDAFTASAIFLKDLGAARGEYSDEKEAALRYYAGGAWKKKQNQFYGNQVMKKAQDIQDNQIDALTL